MIVKACVCFRGGEFSVTPRATPVTIASDGNDRVCVFVHVAAQKGEKGHFKLSQVEDEFTSSSQPSACVSWIHV